jgi:hypothetical protein
MIMIDLNSEWVGGRPSARDARKMINTARRVARNAELKEFYLEDRYERLANGIRTITFTEFKKRYPKG